MCARLNSNRRMAFVCICLSANSEFWRKSALHIHILGTRCFSKCLLTQKLDNIGSFHPKYSQIACLHVMHLCKRNMLVSQ
jgi:hypothetical protein